MSRKQPANEQKLLAGQWTEGWPDGSGRETGYWTQGGDWVPPRIHPQPSEQTAETWLRSLSELDAVTVNIGWRALKGWNHKDDLVTILDVLSNLPGPFVLPVIQIDTWASNWDRAQEIAQIIRRAASSAEHIRLMREPMAVQPSGPPRYSMDLTFDEES